MKPSEFLTHLWGPEPPGLIQLWRLHDRRSYYLRAPAGANYYADDKPDIYTGVALAHTDHGPRRRCPNNQAAAIPGLWLDIDVNGGPDNKQGAAPTEADAWTLAHAVHRPTILIHSGHGLQAWWLLDAGPWRFATRQEQHAAAELAARWQQLHRAHAAFQLDHTHDLARLMRPPGTVNAKGGAQAPVTVADHHGTRYTLPDLQDLATNAPLPGPVLEDPVDGPLVDITPRQDGAPPEDLFNALLENSPDFKRTWAHARHGKQWSLSEYDLSLASQAAQAGWTDQQLADLISLHRRVHNPYGTKGQRPDYIRRTVAKARASHQRAQGIRDLAQLDTERRQASQEGVAALQALLRRREAA